jgi:hypothetical protein
MACIDNCVCCGITTTTGDRRLLQNAPSIVSCLVSMLETKLKSIDSSFTRENILMVVKSGYVCRKCHGLLDKFCKTQDLLKDKVMKAVEVIFPNQSVSSGSQRLRMDSDDDNPQIIPPPKRFVPDPLMSQSSSPSRPDLSVSNDKCIM